METVRLVPEVLDWAASQVGSTLEEFAYKISKRSFEQIIGWQLTSVQAIKFSKSAGVPLGYLFLPTPPEARKLPIADFRTLPNPQPLSKDFFEVFDDIEYKQVWYKEYLITAGASELPFVGRFKGKKVTAKAVARDMRQLLNLLDKDILHLRAPDELYSLLTAKCERVGVLIFKNGVVGNNTKRHLSVSEFRGFVLTDRYAPFIFVNGADAPAAWAFTLAHELAHVWLGESGISDATPRTQNTHERFCNAIAAEFLVPETAFMRFWNSSESSIEARLEQARRQFKVSGLVIARRALELGLIEQTTYSEIYEGVKHNKKMRVAVAIFISH